MAITKMATDELGAKAQRQKCWNHCPWHAQRFGLTVVLYMLSQQCAAAVQTVCMVVVPAPMMRLPESHVYTLYSHAIYGPRLRIVTYVTIVITISYIIAKH